MCIEDYNMLREDINNYTYSWKTYNSSYKPKYSFERVYNAFQYRSANDLNGYPVVGIYNTYWGGGYVYEMRGQKSYLQGNLSLLQSMNWIDSQTRVVIIEFSVFNPNINLIVVAEIVVEFLSTGTIITSARFDPITVFTKLSWFQLICHIIYILFIVYFSIQEIRKFFRHGRKYLLQFWTLVEWSIIFSSWAAFSLFINRISAANAVGKFFNETSGYGYFKFQNISFWNLVLNYSFALCIVFGTLKFLKIFRFDKRISFLSSTLENCLLELLSFGFMYILIYMAFVQLFHLYFQRKMVQFSSIMKSMTTCFEIALGKFQMKPLLDSDSFFGPIFYTLYNVLIVFILLTMFISIINDSFKSIRTRSKKNSYEIIDYIRDYVFGKKNKNMIESGKKSNEIVYKDQVEYLNDKVEELLLILNDVNKLLII
jgi:hypothetical protein